MPYHYLCHFPLSLLYIYLQNLTMNSSSPTWARSKLPISIKSKFAPVSSWYAVWQSLGSSWSPNMSHSTFRQSFARSASFIVHSLQQRAYTARQLDPVTLPQAPSYFSIRPQYTPNLFTIFQRRLNSFKLVTVILCVVNSWGYSLRKSSIILCLLFNPCGPSLRNLC